MRVRLHAIYCTLKFPNKAPKMTQQIEPVVANNQVLDQLVRTIHIPPKPSLLVEMQKELNKEEPCANGLAKVISNDVAMSASLMKLTNSSFFGLRLQARSVDHAVRLIGLNQTGILMTGIIARQTIEIKAQSLRKFWDHSSKRAHGLSALVGRFPVCTSDIAHTFGLFCDIGVPILMERFPDYADTWKKANNEPVLALTQVEDQAYNTNHAAIGSLMARTWGLPESVSMAILLHHDYATLEDRSTSELIRGLIALTSLVEFAIQKFEGQESSCEWTKSGERVCQYLGISMEDADDWCEELQDLFHKSR